MVESGVCEVEIACENVRDEDAIALVAGLSTEKCDHLERLHLLCDTIGELGRSALQQMMKCHRANLVINTPGLCLGYFEQEIEPAMASATCVTLRILDSKRKEPLRPVSWP